jgi:hypothetical protein
MFTREEIDKILEDAPQVRPLTRLLMYHMLWDLPLNHVECDDFGIASADHYRALRAVMEALIEEEGMVNCALILDQAMGNGPVLTKLAQTHAPAYPVTFSTVWDLLQGRT